MTACLIVRARVTDAAVKEAFDRWYRDDHLPRATAAFGARRSWRAWSTVDPMVHYACYEYDDIDAAHALRDSDALRRFVAEFDDAWGNQVDRERDYIDIVQAMD